MREWSAILLATVTACSVTSKRPAPVLPPAEASSAVEAKTAELPQANEDNDVSQDDGPLPSNKPPLIRIHNVVGTTPAEAGIMFADSTDAMEQCHNGDGGVLHIHLRGEGERAHMAVSPESTVDPATSGCVLRALSIADFTEAADQSASPSDTPKRFESQLTISWR